MTIELTKTVGEIAVENPAVIPFLEDMKIDYCCGGNRTLGDACQLAGVPAEKVISTLKKIHLETPKADPAVDWKDQPVSAITHYILEKHHTYTRSQLARIKKLASKVTAVHGARHPELTRVEEIAKEMAEEMEGHMAKEEEQVFPYLTALEKAGWKKEAVPDPFQGGPLTNHPLKVLMWEHGMTGEEFEELHRLTNDFTLPDDACGSYQALYAALSGLEQDLHRHVHLENNILFRKAMEKRVLD